MTDIKIPPQAKEIEEALIGALLLDHNAYSHVAELLSSDMFYVTKNGIIYDTVGRLVNKSIKPDLLSVMEELRSIGKLQDIGGISYLSEITNMVSSSVYVTNHAKIIYQKFVQREIIRISNELQRDAYEDITDPFSLLDLSLTTLTKLTIGNNTSNIISVGNIGLQIQKSIVSGEPIANEIKMGIGELSILTKTFNVVAGFQGTGKTAMMVTCAREQAKRFPVGILSIEMSAQMLASKFFQMDTGINSKRIISNNLEDQEKSRILDINELESNIYVDDSGSVTQQNIVSKITSFVIKHGIKVLWIDYLQLIELMAGNISDTRKMEMLTNSLQNIAKDLDISIVALSQLKRTDEKPQAKDLRGGGIEQAPSDIWILWDSNWRENAGKKWADISPSTRGKLTLICAKGRYGEVADMDIYFDKPFQKMSSWDMHESTEFYNSFTEEIPQQLI